MLIKLQSVRISGFTLQEQMFSTEGRFTLTLLQARARISQESLLSFRRGYREETYFDFVSFVCTHYEIMGYSARLEFTGHAEGEGVTSGLTGTLSHHERSFRLLAQYLQRYLSRITVVSC